LLHCFIDPARTRALLAQIRVAFIGIVSVSCAAPRADDAEAQNFPRSRDDAFTRLAHPVRGFAVQRQHESAESAEDGEQRGLFRGVRHDQVERSLPDMLGSVQLDAEQKLSFIQLPAQERRNLDVGIAEIDRDR
jgi:hypothetical protein